jgi:2-phospho-L-lactate transferase/gluconeogenesis factor (CofD/UPF0052 family)
VGFGSVCRRYDQIELGGGGGFTVSISGGAGMFVPLAMVVETADATGVPGSFSSIVVTQLVVAHCIACHLCESVG